MSVRLRPPASSCGRGIVDRSPRILRYLPVPVFEGSPRNVGWSLVTSQTVIQLSRSIGVIR